MTTFKAKQVVNGKVVHPVNNTLYKKLDELKRLVNDPKLLKSDINFYRNIMALTIDCAPAVAKKELTEKYVDWR